MTPLIKENPMHDHQVPADAPDLMAELEAELAAAPPTVRTPAERLATDLLLVEHLARKLRGLVEDPRAAFDDQLLYTLRERVAALPLTGAPCGLEVDMAAVPRSTP
jgi:hypothetical protein